MERGSGVRGRAADRRHEPLALDVVVRMTLVPAVMALLGRSAWRLPRRLGRLIPHVDIEGERLVAPIGSAAAHT